MNAIKEQANFFHKNRLVLDAGTMEHLKQTGVAEDSRIVMELDADVFTKAKERMITMKGPKTTRSLVNMYDNLQKAYQELRGNNFYASASDIMRYVAFTAYSDQADHLVYHDADVRFKPLDKDHQTDLGSGADMKAVMVTSTKRTDEALANQLSFVEPSYFYDRTPYEYPDYTQFNSDLIFMRKAAATREAVKIGVIQLRTIMASRIAIVEKSLGTEMTKMTLHEAITTPHPEEATFKIPSETSKLLYRNRDPVRTDYTPTQMKSAYVGAVGLNPLDIVLQEKMDRAYKTTGPPSDYVEIGGENYLRLETNVFLRTLELKGDTETRNMVISESALNPGDVGAVTRQDAQNWYGDVKGNPPNVPVYTLKEEATITGSNGSPLSSPEHSRPSSPELLDADTPVEGYRLLEQGLVDNPAPGVDAPAPEMNGPASKVDGHAPEGNDPAVVELNVDMSTLSFGSNRQPPDFNPETEPEAFEQGIRRLRAPQQA